MKKTYLKSLFTKLFLSLKGDGAMIKEFECKDCGKIIEIWERFDKIPKCCEVCGGEIKQIISQTSFSLKGTCWARDHYGLAKIHHKPAKVDSN